MLTEFQKMVVIAGAVLVFGFLAYRDRVEDVNSAATAANSLAALVTYNDDFCKERGKNLLVRVQNTSDRTLLGFKLYIDAKVPQFSNSVVTGNATIDSDRILEPNEEWISCFDTPELKAGLMVPLENLNWFVEPRLVVEEEVQG
jgi:hypothetical protein